ncbi:MAG: P-II family nitrogen regulator [Pirellulales bacterium]
MKQVVAIVRPFLAEKVLECLRQFQVEAIQVTEVKGYGRQKSYLDRYTQNEYSLAFLPKIEISCWVDDVHVNDVTKRIVEVARSGRMGDGKIFVLPAPLGIDIATYDEATYREPIRTLVAPPKSKQTLSDSKSRPKGK